MSALLKLVSIVLMLAALFLIAVIVTAIVKSTGNDYTINAGPFAGFVVGAILFFWGSIRLWRHSSTRA